MQLIKFLCALVLIYIAISVFVVLTFIAGYSIMAFVQWEWIQINWLAFRSCFAISLVITIWFMADKDNEGLNHCKNLWRVSAKKDKKDV